MSSHKKAVSIVGVGASAGGGLEALTRMFGAADIGSPLAFVVVQHLSPDYRSMVAELVGKHTDLAVVRAEDGLTIAPRHVYVIEPQTTVEVSDGKLRVAVQERDGALRLPIDLLFRSLATELGPRAVCVSRARARTGPAAPKRYASVVASSWRRIQRPAPSTACPRA